MKNFIMLKHDMTTINTGVVFKINEWIDVNENTKYFDTKIPDYITYDSDRGDYDIDNYTYFFQSFKNIDQMLGYYISTIYDLIPKSNKFDDNTSLELNYEMIHHILINNFKFFECEINKISCIKKENPYEYCDFFNNDKDDVINEYKIHLSKQIKLNREIDILSQGYPSYDSYLMSKLFAYHGQFLQRQCINNFLGGVISEAYNNCFSQLIDDIKCCS